MTDHEVEALVVRMVREHRSWGYDRLVGPLANLGDTVRAQTGALSSSAMASHQRQSARPSPPGRSSSARIWTVVLRRDRLLYRRGLDAGVGRNL